MRLVSDFFKDVVLFQGEVIVTDDRYFIKPIKLNLDKDRVHEPELIEYYRTESLDKYTENDFVERYKCCQKLNELLNDIRKTIKPAHDDDDFLMYSYLDKDILSKLAEDSDLRSISLKKCKIVVDDYKYFRNGFGFYPLHYNCLGELLKDTFSDDELIIKLGFLVQTIRNLHKNHKHEKNKLPSVDIIV